MSATKYPGGENVIQLTGHATKSPSLSSDDPLISIKKTVGLVGSNLLSQLAPKGGQSIGQNGTVISISKALRSRTGVIRRKVHTRRSQFIPSAELAPFETEPVRAVSSIVGGKIGKTKDTKSMDDVTRAEDYGQEIILRVGGSMDFEQSGCLEPMDVANGLLSLDGLAEIRRLHKDDDLVDTKRGFHEQIARQLIRLYQGSFKNHLNDQHVMIIAKLLTDGDLPTQRRLASILGNFKLPAKGMNS